MDNYALDQRSGGRSKLIRQVFTNKIKTLKVPLNFKGKS